MIVIDPKSFLDPKRCFACAITYAAWNPCNQVAWVMEFPVNSGPPHSSSSDTAHRCSSGCSVLLHESHPGRATLGFFCCVFFRRVIYLLTFRAESKPLDLLWLVFQKIIFWLLPEKFFFITPRGFPPGASLRHDILLLWTWNIGQQLGSLVLADHHTHRSSCCSLYKLINIVQTPKLFWGNRNFFRSNRSCYSLTRFKRVEQACNAYHCMIFVD